MKNLRKLIAAVFTLCLFGSCNYSLYQVNKGNASIKKNESYHVIYTGIVPEGAAAKITYIDAGQSKITLNHISGKWVYDAVFKPEQEMLFKIDVRLPASTPRKKLSTSIVVNGEVFSEYIQTGRNVRYRVKFKLP